MADADDDFASQEDRLKAAWRAAVLSAVEEQNTTVPVSRECAASLVELVEGWATQALAPDLEQFAHHARRTIVSVDDVLLAARKNERTRACLAAEAARMNRGTKRRGTKRRASGGAAETSAAAGVCHEATPPGARVSGTARTAL
jgi:centromere protein S